MEAYKIKQDVHIFTFVWHSIPSIHAHSIHAPILNRDFFIFSYQYNKDHHFERNGYEHIMVRQIPPPQAFLCRKFG